MRVLKFDELLEDIGEFGPYQQKIFILSCLVTVTAGSQVLSVVFLLNIPNYRCAIPSYLNDSYNVQGYHHELLINLTIPMVEDVQGLTSYSKCSLYNVTSQTPGDNFTQYGCQSWVYDTSIMENTVISEFNMVCENEIYRSLNTMIGFGGAIAGSIVFGVLSDVIGRMKALLLGVLLSSVDGIIAAVSQSFLMYTVTVFFFGFTASGIFKTTMVIGMEIVGPHKRTFTGLAVGFFWVGGLFVLTFFAYFIRRWRILRVVIGAPPILFIALLWLIPESPRWLLSRGKYEKAKKIIRKIAKSNKADLTEAKLDMVTADEEEESSLHFWHMFMSPGLLLRSLIIYFTTFTVALVYFGLSINVSNLSGDIYLNFFLSSLMELIGYVGTLILLYKVDRRPLLIVVMLVGGVACLASIFPVLYGNESAEWTLTAISMVGKLGASAAFSIADIYSVELFPTVVRQSSVAVCNIFVNVGGMTAPYIADLGILVGGDLTDALPLIAFGSLSVAAGLLGFFLPETRNRALPETIEDSIEFGRGKQEKTIIVEDEKPHEENITRL